MQHPSDSRRRAAGLCGLGAAALALAVPLVGGLARPGYDAVAQYVSELGERGAAHGALVSLGGFLPIGALGLAFVALAEPLGSLAGRLCFAAVPLAYVVAAFARCDAGCPADGSTEQAIHSAFGLLEYLGGVSGLVLFARAFRAAPAWRSFALPSLVAALATLVGFLGMLTAPSARGAFQRLAEAALFLWIASVSVQLLRGAPGLAQARAAFAEQVRELAGVRSAALVHAFATVPREVFVGPGPWKLLRLTDLGRGYETTPDADPRRLYDNVLVALDAERRLNNGEPAGLARWLDSLELAPGERFLHVGCGVGYYTAIAAHALEPGGEVVALEIDPVLAARARINLATHAPGARVADGPDSIAGESFDAIFVNAGATRPEPAWLDALRPGGRLLVPLTVDGLDANLGLGWMLLVARGERGWSARFTTPVGVFHCAGARDPEESDALRDAFRRGGHERVSLLRRDAHAPDADCWLHGAGFCLSLRGQSA